MIDWLTDWHTWCGCGDAAYCKNPLNDQWYNFDDHRVSKLRPDAVVTKSAYLLFYRRRLAQTRCAVSLLQWVSSVCSASYGHRTTSDDAAHTQSGNNTNSNSGDIPICYWKSVHSVICLNSGSTSVSKKKNISKMLLKGREVALPQINVFDNCLKWL